jgi:predicted negative regulator of RcsB-dependent stress response
VAFDLEEQEKLAELKAWWAKYGNLVTALIFLAALSVLGVNGYNAWKAKKSGDASLVYDQMEKAITTKNAVLVKETAATLMSDFWFKRTAYAQMAALDSARYDVDAGDLKSAEAQLQWAADHAADSQYRLVARLRLASVQMDLGEGDLALKTLAGDVPDQFVSAFADRRGDIYLAQNKLADARTQYQLALDNLKSVGEDVQVAYTNVEKLKLDALASATGAMASAANPPAVPGPNAAPATAATSAAHPAAPAAPSSVEK